MRLLVPSSVTLLGEIARVILGSMTSSLAIVPCPWLSAMVTLRPLAFRLLKLMKKVSLLSTLVSPLTTTVIVLEVSPALKIKGVVAIAV
jgi:hypothetical protein